MTNQEELKLLKKCLFYYNLPKLIIWFLQFEIVCINQGVELKITYFRQCFCYYFKRFHNTNNLPKHLKLAYIGSKYYKDWRFNSNGWWIDEELSKTKRLTIRIELLKSAINSLKQQIKNE